MPAKEDASIRKIPAARVFGLLLMALGNDNSNHFLKTGIDSWISESRRLKRIGNLSGWSSDLYPSPRFEKPDWIFFRISSRVGGAWTRRPFSITLINRGSVASIISLRMPMVSTTFPPVLSVFRKTCFSAARVIFPGHRLKKYCSLERIGHRPGMLQSYFHLSG